MTKKVKLNGALGQLGREVELRDLSVGQWLELQRDDYGENEYSMRLLAMMMHIDGQPIGWDRLLTLGMSDIQPAIGKLNTMLGGGDEGNG